MPDIQPSAIPPGYTSEQDRALRMLTYGCYVVSAADETNMPRASTVSWVSQTSFKPPLLMIAVHSEGSLCKAIDASEKFAINIVGEDQIDLAEKYIRRETYAPLDPEDFDAGEFGVPVLKAMPGCLECQVVGKLTGGDHTIFVGRLEAGVIRDDAARPLMLADSPWVYAGLAGRE
ncbi:MAG: flavin reductase family protein [Anaerolineae bacterium]